jgi:ABC-type Na+ efflux pump permease subunit
VKAHNVWLVFKKDWLEIKRNSQVLAPIIILPLIFSVVFPVILMVISNTSSTVNTTQDPTQDFQALIQNLPQNVQAQLADMTPMQVMVYIMAVYFFSPFFLIIPIMASSVTSSDSFAGEKERKTIEALLATPISDTEMLLGKVLVSFIPAMAITLVAFSVYATIVDITTFSLFGSLLLPNLVWVIMVLGVAPTLALCSVGLTVIISSRVKGFKEAQQISAVLLLPVLGIVFAQLTGFMILGPEVLAILIGVLALVNVAIFYVGKKLFKREEILSQAT